MSPLNVFRAQDPTLDLKTQILQLKKELYSYKTENQLLKVKVRKLNEDVSKRDKQILILLDPSMSSNYKRLISEKQASLVFTLSQETEHLKHCLHEKDSIIKKLQNQLQLTKLYVSKPSEKRKPSAVKRNDVCDKLEISVPYYDKVVVLDPERDRNDIYGKGILKSISLGEIPRMRSAEHKKNIPLSARLTKNFHVSNGKDTKEIPTHDDFLLKLVNKLREGEHHYCTPVETDTESIVAAPHEEMEELQSCVFDVIAEVDQLKQAVSLMKQHNADEGKEKDAVSIQKHSVNNCNKKPLMGVFKQQIITCTPDSGPDVVKNNSANWGENTNFNITTRNDNFSNSNQSILELNRIEERDVEFYV